MSRHRSGSSSYGKVVQPTSSAVQARGHVAGLAGSVPHARRRRQRQADRMTANLPTTATDCYEVLVLVLVFVASSPRAIVPRMGRSYSPPLFGWIIPSMVRSASGAGVSGTLAAYAAKRSRIGARRRASIRARLVIHRGGSQQAVTDLGVLAGAAIVAALLPSRELPNGGRAGARMLDADRGRSSVSSLMQVGEGRDRVPDMRHTWCWTGASSRSWGRPRPRSRSGGAEPRGLWRLHRSAVDRRPAARGRRLADLLRRR